MRLLQLRIGEVINFEICTDELYIACPLIGHIWKAKGERLVWDSWNKVKEIESRWNKKKEIESCN